MKVLIEIDEGLIDSLKNGSFGIKYNTYDLCGAVANGIPLEGTNGEVLMKMFPPSVYFPSEGKYMALLTKDCIVSCSNEDWWNADYKGVE